MVECNNCPNRMYGPVPTHNTKWDVSDPVTVFKDMTPAEKKEWEDVLKDLKESIGGSGNSRSLPSVVEMLKDFNDNINKAIEMNYTWTNIRSDLRQFRDSFNDKYGGSNE